MRALFAAALAVLIALAGCSSSDTIAQRATARYNASPSQRAIADYKANGPNVEQKAAFERFKAAADHAAELDRNQLASDITKYGAANVYDCRAKAAAAHSWDAGYAVYSNCILAALARDGVARPVAPPVPPLSAPLYRRL